MKNEVIKYLSLNKEPFNRYNSWNHCYKAFGTLKNDKELALHLAFYLASWGMYRGSSKLLNHDYLIHTKAVSIIKDFQSLRCTPNKEVSIEQIDNIGNFIEKLSSYYQEFDVTPTDTLISKIILGTLGCLPAFDRFFIDGVIDKEEAFKSLQKSSLEKLFDYADNNEELKMLKSLYPEYPKMKLVDMCFWQVGFEKSKK